jgi:hypothetical protein
MAILRTARFFLFLLVVVVSILRGIALSSATVMQTFIIPSSGNNTYHGFSSIHNGVDIQDGTARPSATSELCLAELGSVND